MLSYARAGSTAQIIVGSICLTVAAGLVIGGAVSGIGGLLLGAIGPSIAGIINLAIGLTTRRRQSNQILPEAKLTPEARGFLTNLMRSTNTPWANGYQNQPWNWHWQGGPMGAVQAPMNPAQSFFHQLGKQWGFVPKTPKDVLPKTVHDLLDTACFHYNRIWGLLEAGKSDSSFAKIMSTARNGADEALFSILHHCATLQRYPETVSAAARDCEEKIRALKELADGLESIQSRPASISDRLGYTSAMDSALEEIRLERLAREELHTQPDEETNHLRDRL